MTTTTIAVVIPVRGGALGPGALECVAEAGPSSSVIVIGDDASLAASDLAGHVASVVVIEAEGFRPGAWAQALAQRLSDRSVALLPRSADGRDLAPRLAAVLDRELYAGCIALDLPVSGPVTATQVRHGGRTTRTVEIAEPLVATLEPGCRSVGVVDPGATVALDVVELAVVDCPDPETLEVRPPDAATVDLAEARRIVGAGAGLLDVDRDVSDERIEELRRVGLALGAALGATRVVTDAGHLGHDRQIGTTGVVVAPEIYLAFGVSGAIQHTAGLGHPRHVVSVNLDPHCPMAAMADLAVVADASAVVRALHESVGVEPEARDGEPASNATGVGR